MIDVYSNMFNEEFIVPYWLRHYETFADRIFIWDDASTDRTKELLSKSSKVTFLPMEKHGDDDGYWTQVLFPRYEQYSRGVADWVIIADADEFIYHSNLLGVLAGEKERKTQLIRCEGFAMVSENPPTTSNQIYEEIKMGLPDVLESKWTIFSPDATIRYGRGRHVKPLCQKGCTQSNTTGIKLLHYRYLGAQFFEEHDQKLCERLRMIYHFKKEYSHQVKRTLPDRTRGVALDWYATHKNEAKNVVDNI